MQRDAGIIHRKKASLLKEGRSHRPLWSLCIERSTMATKIADDGLVQQLREELGKAQLMIMQVGRLETREPSPEPHSLTH